MIDNSSDPGSWARAMGRGCVPNAADYQPADASNVVQVDDVSPLHEESNAR